LVYLILQILWFLVVAAVIGFAVGWLCRSLAIARQRETSAIRARAAEGEAAGLREQFEQRLAEADSARKALQEELAQARKASEADALRLRKLEREQGSMAIKLEARERELARSRADPEAGQGVAPGSLVRQK
jgi:hypothetical protein